MLKCFEEGKRAFQNNISIFECPYAGFTVDASQWLSGWQDAHLTRVASNRVWEDYQCAREREADAE